jgi:hypothetical protein
LKKGEELALRMQLIDQTIAIYYLQMRVYYHLEKSEERDEAFKQFDAYESKRALAVLQQLTDADEMDNLEGDMHYLSLL